VTQWVCKTHEKIVLFSTDDKNISENTKHLSMIPILSDTPRLCPKCGRYYYRHECETKEDES
jgi:hypothetical protein